MNNTTAKSAQATIDMCWNLVILFAVMISVNLVSDAAFAQQTNAIQTVFCNVVAILTGTTGKAIATVAIIAVGIGALLGKISWGMALIVAIGVALIFGAASIVDALGSNSASCSGFQAISNR